MPTSDEFLLTQFKQGDVRAFREIAERYTAPIYNLAYRLLRDPMEAENITQETFLRVVAALEHLRLDIPFKPYIFRVAVNLCRDLGRKKRPLLFTDLRDDDAPDVLDDAPPLWEQAAEEELRAQLYAALDDLPAVYQTVLTLRYVEEFSYEEIAQATSLPLNTVRTQLRRAKQQLRLKLDVSLNSKTEGAYE